ncbi:MAG: radical SAM protein [Candidatus Woesearchaeota archaeon]
MKIKLIYPPVFDHIIQPFPPISIPILTAALRKNGYVTDQDDLLIRVRSQNWFRKPNLKVFSNEKNLNEYLIHNRQNPVFEKTLSKILHLTQYQDYNLIGLSALSLEQFLFALLLGKKIKDETGTPIVIGGYHLNSMTPEFFDKITFVDYVIIGGAELSIIKLVQHIEGKVKEEDVPGLMYRKQGKVHLNGPRNIPIDEVPVADFEGLPISLYSPYGDGKISLPYQISRGCSHRCSFCEVSGGKFEKKSLAKVLAELELLISRYKAVHFEFTDATINSDYEYLKLLCEKMISGKLKMDWYALARADNLDATILRKMKGAGCKKLLFGIESGSDRLLRFMQKGINARHAASILQISHDVGITNWIFLMSGIPGETHEDLKKTVSFIGKNSKYISRITIGVFYILSNSLVKKDPASYCILNVDDNIRFLRQNLFSGQYTDKKQVILKKLSYDTVFLAYWKYIIRKRKPYLKCIPISIVCLYLRMKHDKVRISAIY